MLPQLALVFILIVINAAFAGTELALVTLREAQLQRLERASATGAILARLAREPNTFLATIQIAITLAGFLASAAAAVSLAEPLEDPLRFLGAAAGPVAVMAITLILSYFTLVFGELAPKRVAMQKAEQWGLLMARPLAALSRLTKPAVWFLSRSTNVAVRAFGADPNLQREEVTEEHLRDMVAAQSTFTAQQRRIIDGAFEIAQRTLREVMVPRSDVFVLDAAWTPNTALQHLRTSGHSRAPVAPNRTLDFAVGSIHLRDLLTERGTAIGSITTATPIFPAGARVLDTLRDLQTQRTQLAFVANEHGDIEGIVTIEDLVEELVGEIYDETDPDLASVHHEDGGALTLPGRFPIHDLPDIGVELPDGQYATIAGFVLDQLGYIPTAGESFDFAEWHVEVVAVQRHSITTLRLIPRPTQGANQ